MNVTRLQKQFLSTGWSSHPGENYWSIWITLLMKEFWLTTPVAHLFQPMVHLPRVRHDARFLYHQQYSAESFHHGYGMVWISSLLCKKCPHVSIFLVNKIHGNLGNRYDALSKFLVGLLVWKSRASFWVGAPSFYVAWGPGSDPSTYL